MGDQPAGQGALPGIDPGAAGGGAPPAAGTPPPAAAAPAPAAAAPRPPGKGSPPKPGKTPPGTPSAAAFADLTRKLRETKRELAKLQGKGGEPAAAPSPSPAPAAGASSPVPAPAAQPRAERSDAALVKLQRELAEARDRVERQKLKIKSIRHKERDRRTALELRHDAVASGVIEEHADFALSLFSAAVRAAVSATPPREIPEARAFFAELRKARPYLFDKNAAAVPLLPATAPGTAPSAGTRAEGEPPAAAPAPKKDAMEMSEQEWRDHKRRIGMPHLS